jgi:hypothetical protein
MKDKEESNGTSRRQAGYVDMHTIIINGRSRDITSLNGVAVKIFGVVCCNTRVMLLELLHDSSGDRSGRVGCRPTVALGTIITEHCSIDGSASQKRVISFCK